MTIKESLLTEFDHEVGATRELPDRVLDAQLGWKPHERSMSLGGLATMHNGPGPSIDSPSADEG